MGHHNAPLRKNKCLQSTTTALPNQLAPNSFHEGREGFQNVVVFYDI